MGSPLFSHCAGQHRNEYLEFADRGSHKSWRLAASIRRRVVLTDSNRGSGRDQALESQYSRHFYIISRGGQYARISWGDGKTYELSTAKMEAGKLQWRFTDTWRLAADGQQIISASSGRKRNHAEAVRDFLMLLEA